jgi:nucleoside-diphosphate-sugar epimerase
VPAKLLAREDLDLVLALMGQLWDELRDQRIFLTGGTGFFGCWLVESFCHANRTLELNAEMTILTRNPEAFQEKCPHLAADPSITLHAGDVRTFNFPDGEFAFVIHAAAETMAKPSADEHLEMFSTIVTGTERTLESAAAHGTRKFLLTSSGAVYGRQPDELTHVPESYAGAPDPMNPAQAYAEGKRAAELLCAMYSKRSGMECKIARCWAFCGPHLPLNEHFAIGNFIGDVLAGRPIQIQGDGTPRRSYLYAADLAVWLWTILVRAPALTPINIGSDHDVSILELAQTVAATLRPQSEIHIAREQVPGAVPSRYVPSVNRAYDLLGLRETVSLEDSIRRTAEWHRSE